MQRNFKLLFSIFLSCFLTPAWAHPDIDHVQDFGSGFMHLWLGSDHLIVMFAVGLYASRLKDTASLGLLGTFLVFMANGAIAAFLGIAISGIELGILLSLVILGVLLISNRRAPAKLISALMAGFALCHGYSHAVEITTEISAASYLIGLILSTAIIIGIGLGAGKVSHKRLVYLRTLTALISVTVGVLALVN